ncbi:TetR/AcrR family transcriptional regulator [Afipia sp. DC4300-2b1]|uniref:TetR/AcrR family transcriptional regulator n=1 Tax=Afipia sp. DC4300-2b1 TaxID=2804672 RepID=UPI003CEAEA33
MTNTQRDADLPHSVALQRKKSGGRPTREEAVHRDARLLDIATTLFMERGFDGTSIDAVAESAGVSKPTVYNRYKDKRDLFAAVLRSRIRLWLAPISAAAESQMKATGVESVEETLHQLSLDMLAHSMTPDVAMLQRVVAAQAMRFPELATLAHEEGWLRAVRGVATLLRHFGRLGQIKADDPAVEADLFLNLVLGHAKRLALFGIAVVPAEEEVRRRKAVELFLNGTRTR